MSTFYFPFQLDALCPAAEELMKLSTASPGGHIAVLQAAVEVEFTGTVSLIQSLSFLFQLHDS